jgi:hypothetical protein
VTVIEGIDATIALTGTDEEGDALTATITTLPANGALYQTPNGITRGALIPFVPAPVTDTSLRIIYASAGGSGQNHGNFGFIVNGGKENSDEATISVNVTPGVLVISTDPQTIFTDQISGPITLEIRDVNGNPATSVDNVTVALSSSSSTDVFDTDPAGPFNGIVVSVTIPAGQTSATVFYKDSFAGTHTLTATAANFSAQTQTAEQTITVTERASVLAISSDSSVFEGDSFSITIEMVDANGDAAGLPNDAMVTLSSSSSTTTFNPPQVTIPAGQTSATVSGTDLTVGTSSITATAPGLASATRMINVISAISSPPTVSGSPATAGDTITVTASGRSGVTGTFSIGAILLDAPLTEDAGTYTGTFTPADSGVQDGIHDLVVKVGNSSQTVPDAVTIDTIAPTLTDPTVDADRVKNGDTVTLSVVSSDPEAQVWADVSALDTTQGRVDFVKGAGSGLYDAIFTISSANEAGNGRKSILIHAEDVVGNAAASVSAGVRLRNSSKLKSNYPNPFNPETWIPYRLAKEAVITLTIYDATGRIVRSIDVGYRRAGVYESKEKSVHWDGRNNFGERVASGIYFYHLTAGDFSGVRKMLVLK